jgi:type VI secretion system secreted protein VgrG
VSGGASITIEGGSFTAQCPGKISVLAGTKSMVGGSTQSWAMPQMPKGFCLECYLAALRAGSPFAAPNGA